MKSEASSRIVSTLLTTVMLVTGMIVFVGVVPDNASAVTYTDFTLGAASSNMTVTSGADWVKANTQEYQLSVDWSGTYVDFFIKPYFTTDEIMYRRAHAFSGAYTIDEIGTNLDHIGTTVSAWYRSGYKISFNESCDVPARYYINHTFNCFRDYLELNVTYTPGTDTISTTYFIALTTSAGALLNSARYIPSSADDPVSTSAYGGWYPSISFAPAMDFRAKSRTLGIECGYSDAVAYIQSPQWMDLADPFEGGSEVIGLRYCHINSLVDTEWNASGDNFHLFVRPYQYNDGQLCGHLVGYAQWVSKIIAAEWGYNSEPVFPLLEMLLSSWDSTLKTWVEASQIKVATYSDNPTQIDWNYKGASNPNIVNPTPARVPDDWEIWDEDGNPHVSDGLVTWCTPASGPYTTPGTFRWHLIENDSYPIWWTGTQGVFWDMMDSWNSYSQSRQDYQNHTDFVYEGYLKLIQDSFASGYWDYVISNSFYGSLHMAIVSSITCIESYQPSSTFGVDMTVRVQSIMKFVNNIPDQYRPRILVYQYYSTSSVADIQDVYSALFGSARYKFHVNLFSYNSGASQLPFLQTAEEMFKAMGCTRDSDTRIPVGTLDLSSEGTLLTTSAKMVVVNGSGFPKITLTTPADQYIITNLNSAANNFDLIVPTNNYYEAGTNVQERSSMTFGDDGKATFHGTIAAGKTGTVVIREAPQTPPVVLDAAFDYSVDGSTVDFFDMSYSSTFPIVDWVWNFGDGFGGGGKTPSHKYADAGTFIVELQITTSGGSTAITTKQVTITSVTPPGGPAEESGLLVELGTVFEKITSGSTTWMLIGCAGCVVVGAFVPKKGWMIGALWAVALVLLVVWWYMTFGGAKLW